MHARAGVNARGWLQVRLPRATAAGEGEDGARRVDRRARLQRRVVDVVHAIHMHGSAGCARAYLHGVCTLEHAMHITCSAASTTSRAGSSDWTTWARAAANSVPQRAEALSKRSSCVHAIHIHIHIYMSDAHV